MKAALPLLASALALTACVSSTGTPAPAPAPAPAASPAPPQRMITPRTIPQAPPSTTWVDAPLTPGNWRYIDYGAGKGKRALFMLGDDELFDLTCVFEPRGPQILLIRAGQPGTDTLPMTIRTETAQRTLVARADGRYYSIASLPVSDPLLDAMALSKGRFAVEVDGYPPLYLPSYAEVTRVIEDCRG